MYIKKEEYEKLIIVWETASMDDITRKHMQDVLITLDKRRKAENERAKKKLREYREQDRHYGRKTYTKKDGTKGWK